MQINVNALVTEIKNFAPSSSEMNAIIKKMIATRRNIPEIIIMNDATKNLDVRYQNNKSAGVNRDVLSTTLALGDLRN